MSNHRVSVGRRIAWWIEGCAFAVAGWFRPQEAAGIMCALFVGLLLAELIDGWDDRARRRAER